MKKKGSFIQTWKKENVGYIQLDRADKANAYNQTLLNGLASAMDQMEKEEDVRALVITGAGKRSFCAGADLKEIEKRDYSDGLKLKSSKIFSQIAGYPKVTLAAINGAAVAGGLELALACDIRISSDNATFFLPETKLGLIPAAGGTHRLPKLVGVARAKELILAGCVWNAADALHFGLVSEVVSVDDLLECAQQWGARIGQRDQLALELAKKAIHSETDYHMESKIRRDLRSIVVQHQE